MRTETDMEPNISAQATPESAARKPHKPRRRCLVLGILAFALSAYSVAAALWWTTENAFLTPTDQLLWISLPAGLLGMACIAVHLLVRRRRSIA